MGFILTLVSSTIENPLSAGHLAKLEQFFDEERINMVSGPTWLHTHKAADINLTDKPSPLKLERLEAFLAPDGIDFFIIPDNKNRKKKLLIADMDSTIVQGETLDDLANQCDLKDKISAITTRAMKGEIDFKSALKERVAMLKDLPEEALLETLSQTKLMKGARKLIGTMCKYGAVCVLVSGSFTAFTKAIASQAGFDHHHGNILGLKDGKLTGKVKEPILDRESKLTFLKDYTQNMGLNLSETLAIGDGANDLDMLIKASLGVGYYPKALLKKEMDNNILYGDLTALLYAQGYREEDIL